MPRRRRWRRFFRRNFFIQQDIYQIIPVPTKNPEPILITREELEILKLSDFEGLTHEEIANRIGVSRPTVTRIVNEARKKLIQAIVEGRPIQIIY